MTGAAKIRGVRSSGWRAIALVLLLAFTLQSYITQTHMDDGTPASAVLIKAITGGTGHGKMPTNNPANCPFCQAVAHSGAFSMPALLLVILSATVVELTAPPVLRRALNAIAVQGWRSRAPPQR